MWLICILACISLWGVTSILYKKGANKEDNLIHYKFSISVGIICLIIAIIFLIIRDEEISIFESAIRIWPMTLFGIIYAIGTTYTFKGYVYNDASIEAPIENTANGFCLIILIAVFAVLGNVGSIWEILSPFEMVGIICIFLGLLLISVIQHKESKAQGKNRLFRSGASALVFPIIYSMMDGLETILTGVCFDQNFGYAMPVDDSVIIIGFEYGFFALGFWIYVSVKEKHIFNPFTKSNVPFVSGAVCDNVALVLYANAMASNAVATDPILAIYPVITIILSKILLKEKLSVKQYLSLALMLFGSVFIVLGENVRF